MSAETLRSSRTPTTVSHWLPTLMVWPIGSWVVKNRDFTPCPMIVTGDARVNCGALNAFPSATLRFITRK
jgi:hypothetical protein